MEKTGKNFFLAWIKQTELKKTWSDNRVLCFLFVLCGNVSNCQLLYELIIVWVHTNHIWKHLDWASQIPISILCIWKHSMQDTKYFHLSFLLLFGPWTQGIHCASSLSHFFTVCTHDYKDQENLNTAYIFQNVQWDNPSENNID